MSLLLRRFSKEERALLLGRKQLPQQESCKIKVVEEKDRVARHLTQKQLKRKCGIAYLSLPLFPSEEMLDIAIRQRPWTSYFSFFNQDRQQKAHYLSQIWQGRVAALTISWINAPIGYGVFADEHIENNGFIAAYTGVVRQVSRRFPDTNAYCLRYPTKLFMLRVIVIDAKECGNETRFINHSDAPNLDLAYLYDRGLLFFFLKANRPIGKGSQLTFNYGEDYWKNRTKWQLC